MRQPDIVCPFGKSGFLKGDENCDDQCVMYADGCVLASLAHLVLHQVKRTHLAQYLTRDEIEKAGVSQGELAAALRASMLTDADD